MKIRNTSELNDRLSDALAWRKKELSALHIRLLSTPRPHEQAALRRAAVPLLYAHWEGFTKEAASYYLELVSRQRLTYHQLQTCFVALACRRTINDAAQSLRPAPRVQLIDFLLLNQSEQARIPFKDVIDTRSNLNAEALRDIILTLGLSFEPDLASKELLIDGSLVRTRHAIAHGEKEEVDHPTYDQVRELVLFLLDYLKTKFENAAATRLYLRQR